MVCAFCIRFVRCDASIKVSCHRFRWRILKQSTSKRCSSWNDLVLITLIQSLCQIPFVFSQTYLNSPTPHSLLFFPKPFFVPTLFCHCNAFSFGLFGHPGIKKNLLRTCNHSSKYRNNYFFIILLHEYDINYHGCVAYSTSDLGELTAAHIPHGFIKRFLHFI